MKRLTALMLILSLCLVGCGKPQQPVEKSTTLPPETVGEPAPEATVPEASASPALSGLEGLTLVHSPGAGGRLCTLEISAGGAFKGTFYDSDLGDTGDGYPGGTLHQSSFSGRFSEDPSQDGLLYPITAESLTYETPVGQSEIREDTRILYEEGPLHQGDRLELILPGTMVQELPQEYTEMLPLEFQNQATLYGYVLFHPESQICFTSPTVLKAMAARSILAHPEKIEPEILAAIQQSGAADAALYYGKLQQLWDGARLELGYLLTEEMTEEEKQQFWENETALLNQRNEEAFAAGNDMAGDDYLLEINKASAELTKAYCYQLAERLS